MVGTDPKAVPHPALVELGRKMVGLAPGGETLPLRAEAPLGVELALADLISDANGEIVFFNDSGFRSLVLTTDAAVVANGHAGAHVTADGTDVTGLQFVTFDNGLTFYFQEGLDLILAPPG